MNLRNQVLNCIEDSGIVVLENGDFDNLDSITFITAIVSLETEFDLEFPDEYLLMSTFCDFENVMLIVQKLLGNKRGN